MSIPTNDRMSLFLELGGRILFAVLTFAWFLSIPASTWRIDLPTAVAALVAYLVVQAAIHGRTAFGRPAWWVVPAATLADAVAVLGAVASDPYPVPPTLLLVLIAALNLGMRRGWAASVGAVAGATVVIAAALGLREHYLDEVAGDALLFATVFALAALVYFALQSFRSGQLQARAARFADQDAETQLLNRHGFDSAARYLLPLQQRTQLPLVIMLASLDTRGGQPLDHRALAKAVRQFGHVVRQRARRSDVVARLGSEEFALMLFDTPPAGGETLARAMLERFNAWASEQGLDARLTFGMVNTPEEPVAVDQLIARARSAVQRAQKHPSSPGVVTAQSF